MKFDNDENSGPQPVTSYPLNEISNKPQNMVGNALEWTSSYFQEGYHFGTEDYDYKSYWGGQINTYDGSNNFIRLGGGWARPISYLAEIAPYAGFNTDKNSGFRCASD